MNKRRRSGGGESGDIPLCWLSSFFLGYSQQDRLESIVILPIYCRNSPRYNTNAARRQCTHKEKSRQSSLSCFLLPLLQVSLFAYSISKPNCCSHMIIIIIPSWRRRSIVRLCVYLVFYCSGCGAQQQVKTPEKEEEKIVPAGLQQFKISRKEKGRPPCWVIDWICRGSCAIAL